MFPTFLVPLYIRTLRHTRTPMHGLCKIEREREMGRVEKFIGFVVLLLVGINDKANGEISLRTMREIEIINRKGPYLGIVSPNNFELNPLLQSPAFLPHPSFPYIDFSGRRFRFGKISNQSVVIVMTGLGMLNAGVATQLLVSLIRVKGVVHYGIAGNANVNLQIGDVTIPQYWAHSGLWNWQRYGDGPEDELALEANGDYTREIGYIEFSEYNVGNGSKRDDNLLNRVWYQPEEVFPINGTPEVRQHIFWVPVDHSYLALARNLENMELPRCVNTTCLPRPPKVTIVQRGMSASVFVDNAAYRQFLNTKFNATAIEMESAAVALVCHQQRIPFIVIRALSDLAGGNGSSNSSNEAQVFGNLAAQNSVDVLIKFIGLLRSPCTHTGMRAFRTSDQIQTIPGSSKMSLDEIRKIND